MHMKSVFRLHDGVQVRRERFGLLFYHYAGPKLFFVPCEDLVDESFFCGEQALGDLIDAVRDMRGWSEEVAKKQVLRLMELLTSKDLCYEQSVC